MAGPAGGDPALELGPRRLRRRARRAWFLFHEMGPKGTTDGGSRDPADLGWPCARTWRFGREEFAPAGLGSRQQLLDAHAVAGGAPIALERLGFWEALANLR